MFGCFIRLENNCEKRLVLAVNLHDNTTWLVNLLNKFTSFCSRSRVQNDSVTEAEALSYSLNGPGSQDTRFYKHTLLTDVGPFGSFSLFVIGLSISKLLPSPGRPHTYWMKSHYNPKVVLGKHSRCKLTLTLAIMWNFGQVKIDEFRENLEIWWNSIK